MRLFVKAAALLLLRIGVAHAAAATEGEEGFTLSEVQDKIDSYLDQQEGGQETRRRSGSPPTGCDLACGFLSFTLGDQLSYPSDPVYDLEESSYWSQQQALTTPKCRLTPTSSAFVSLAVLTSRVTKCQFAVKSGGHAAFSGASNIQDGLTIDLSGFDEVTVSGDKKETVVGAGNVWYDVYTKLTPMGLTTIGGRVSAIGVGGLTLGGGISFFSNSHGWACDNVNAFEVVFADGSIHIVSPSKYSDLYFALRGGGNNFGIVTRFHLATYPQGDMWAGAQTFVHTADTAVAINNAFAELAVNSPSDPAAQVIIAYAYAQQQGIFVIASDLQYGKPEPNPPILQNFTSIPGPVADTLRITSLPDLTIEFNNTNPGGFRQTYWTYTFHNDAELMGETAQIYMEEVEKIKDAPGLVPSAVYQPITTDMITYFGKNGGNPLGLKVEDGPLNLVNIAISWSDPADDERVLAAAENMVTRGVAAAKKAGLDHPYLYQNYASPKQDVFPSYGADNFAKLKAISKKYDPQRVWQKLQPGYFKLD